MQNIARALVVAAQYIAKIDHAPGELGNGAAEEAIGAKRREIHLHGFGAAVGLDVNGSGMQSGRETQLTVGWSRLTRERDQIGRAEADDQRHDQRCGLAVEEVACRGLAVTGNSDNQACHARRRRAPREVECDGGLELGHVNLARNAYAMSDDWIRLTPALSMSAQALASDPCVSMPRQASSTT